MRAAVCHAYGPPDDLVIEERTTPVPGPGEALVRVYAAAVNFPDVLLLANRYQVSVPLPFTPGSELAGVVTAVGDGVDSHHPGDRVFGAAMLGAFAEEVAMPAATLTPIAGDVDFASAAAFGVVYNTAYHALRSVAEVQAGEWVLVLGAAGGVGLAAVEVARLLGGRVIAAASTQEKLELCRQRGAEHTINYATDDLRQALREIADRGVDVVFDPVGGAVSEPALRGTRWGGRFVTIGFASGEIPRIPLNLVLLKGVIVKGFDFRTFVEHAPEVATRDRAELLDLFAAGKLHPHIGARFPLDRVADALRLVADRQALGKVVIEP